ncbi:hypothetical protein PanWU01x14_371420, partial [Parasponia andersonii]
GCRVIAEDDVIAATTSEVEVVAAGKDRLKTKKSKKKDLILPRGRKTRPVDE